MAFSATKTEWTIAEIASLTDGVISGNSDLTVRGVASIDEATEGDLVFAESAKFVAGAVRSKASAVLTTAELATEAPDKALILVANPRLAFVQVLESFAPTFAPLPGINPTAFVSETAILGKDVSVGANAVIEDGAQIGDRVVIMAGVIVSAGCVIGDDTVIHPNGTLYPFVSIGRRCTLQAGCVIGSDGFGYILVGTGMRKVPHLGTVIVEDDVEVGANCCIDRAKTGATRIGAGTKMDNFVHIAHNVQMGRSCILVAQTGIAGSAIVGDGVIVAAQAGIKDHVTIGAGARILARGGAITNIAAGATVSGFPAKDHNTRLRERAATTRLPDYLKRVRALEARLAALEKEMQK